MLELRWYEALLWIVGLLSLGASTGILVGAWFTCSQRWERQEEMRESIIRETRERFDVTCRDVMWQIWGRRKP